MEYEWRKDKKKGEKSNSCPLHCKLTLAKELDVQYVLDGQVRVEEGFQILTVKLYETKESNLQMVKTIVGQDLSYQAERLGTEIVRFGFRKANFNGKQLLRKLELKNRPKMNYPSRVPSIKIKPESDAEKCKRGVPQQCTKLGAEAQDPKIAMQFYEKGCDGGDEQACLTLGHNYSSGETVAKDVRKASQYYARASKLLQNACSVGNTPSCCSLGER